MYVHMPYLLLPCASSVMCTQTCLSHTRMPLLQVILGLPYDQQIDMWSLGCILAELWTGRVLFQNDSLATLLARVVGILGLGMCCLRVCMCVSMDSSRHPSIPPLVHSHAHISRGDRGAASGAGPLLSSIFHKAQDPLRPFVRRRPVARVYFSQEDNAQTSPRHRRRSFCRLR